MSAVNYPIGLLVDNSGTILSAPVVAVTAVTTHTGSSLSTSLATVNESGTANPISFSYDAVANGEAFVTLSVSQSGHTISNQNATICKFCSKDSSELVTLLSGVNVNAGAIGVSQFSGGMAALLGSAYLVTTGTTTPATADTWATAGLYNGVRFYEGINTGLYAWYNGTNWIISSVVGTNGSAYWLGGATVSSAYTNMGTATGTPTVTPHGNAILAGYQPESPLPTDASITSDVSAALTTMLGGSDAAYTTPGTVGHDIKSAGIAADPWATSLPGAYGTGSAGAILGGVNAQLSTIEGHASNADSQCATAITDLAGVTTSLSAISAVLVFVQGLVGVNSGVKNAVYSGSVLTAADIYLYDTSAHAIANDGTTGVLHHIALAGIASGGNLTSQTSAGI